MALLLQLGQRIGADAAQLPPVQHIKVAGVNAAVGLHHQMGGAAALHGAALRRLPRKYHQQVFKVAVVGGLPSLKILIPGVKGGLEKLGVPLRREGVGLAAGGFVQRVQTFNELLIAEPVFSEKVGDLLPAAGRKPGGHRENVELHAVLFHKFGGRHHPVKGALPGGVQSVAVVDLPGAVQREAHQNVVLGQPAAPGFVQQGAVGLNGVAELHPAGVGLFGGIAGKPLVEFHPHQSRLAALKGQRAYAFALPQAEIHKAVHGGVAHKPKGGELALLGFVCVKAVGAAQVAAAGGGFDEQGKRRHGQGPPYLL